MSMLEWNESLEIKIEDIDNHNRKFVELVNRIHDLLKTDSRAIYIPELVTDMRKFAEIHFHREEKYMNEHSYPEAPAHISEHIGFTEKINKLEKDYIDGKMISAVQIINYLNRWIVNHVAQTDRKLGHFLNSQPLAA